MFTKTKLSKALLLASGVSLLALSAQAQDNQRAAAQKKSDVLYSQLFGGPVSNGGGSVDGGGTVTGSTGGSGGVIVPGAPGSGGPSPTPLSPVFVLTPRI